MKTVLITGATSGIGLEVAKECVKNGYNVLGIGRNLERNNAATKMIEAINNEVLVKYFLADLTEMEEVNKVSKEIVSYIEKYCDNQLFGLVNNAGCVKSWFQTNASGYEHQFALNHLASVLLTNNLMQYLINGKGRILMTSSKSHMRMKIHWKDIMYEKAYRPLMAYKQSKLCNMLFALYLNETYQIEGIKAYGIDPGLVNTNIGLKHTGGIVSFVWNLRKNLGVSPDIPAKTYLWILNQDEHLNSLYYYKSRPRKYSRQVKKENADKLIRLSEKLLNIKYGGQL